MKSSINIVVITGNLAEDPELQSGSGTDYVRFRIGSNRRWKDGDGKARTRSAPTSSTASASTAPPAVSLTPGRAPRSSSRVACS